YQESDKSSERKKTCFQSRTETRYQCECECECFRLARSHFTFRSVPLFPRSLSFLHFVRTRPVRPRNLGVEQPHVHAQLSAVVNHVVQHGVAKHLVLWCVDPGFALPYKLPVPVPRVPGRCYKGRARSHKFLVKLL